jgi:hypothetical protein
MVRYARLRQTFEIAAGEFSDAQSVLASGMGLRFQELIGSA